MAIAGGTSLLFCFPSARLINRGLRSRFFSLAKDSAGRIEPRAIENEFQLSRLGIVCSAHNLCLSSYPFSYSLCCRYGRGGQLWS